MTSQTSSSSSSSWNFRPSALNADYVDQHVQGLIQLFKEDNQKAQAHGVKLLPRVPSTLRTLQWNIHGWMTANRRTSIEVAKEFFDAIFAANADVLVLNEYFFNISDDPTHQPSFEARLHQEGYTTFERGTVACPTAIATKWHVFDRYEVLLEQRRSAILFWIGKTADCENDDRIWVVGTHLDDLDETLRNQQVRTLLNDFKLQEGCLHQQNEQRTKILLLGDFNQQRREDYTKSEWNHIAANKAKRNSKEDDGVSTMLQAEGFRCAWDKNKNNNNNRDALQTNWKTSKPPSTHWTGTIVDYSYGKNISPLQVSIGPAGCSDHRMTVCDWKV